MLEIIGLSSAEEALYEALVERSAATLAELGHEAATAARLEELGLITRLPGDPPRYVAVSPELGLDVLIHARTRELTEARHRIARLAARRHRPVPEPDAAGLVEVVLGREAVSRWFERLQQGARRQVRVFDAPPYATVADGNTAELELLRRGVEYRVLYDRRAMEAPGTLAAITRYIAAGEQARVGDVPVKLVLSDRPMAIMPLRHGEHVVESALVVHDPTLLDALSVLFETSWERAAPLHVRHGRLAEAADAAGAAGGRRDLLPLLAAGLTDAAIAAHLGWSDRTVRRHVRDMTARLDAQTRFQAGYQAVLRGWLAEA
ncbi:helix-turn-helix transcriptional regulator [Nonomuraea basaltis]|uniref:helix-turn-helix transcriptional regulator n=1 Tax=Nonomuraea basaltis TaxID=2495887 RepID=UPI00110C6121|nr:LuxR family transcriptional regulator [Nonomuraea basaltis]TMR88946.1 transcriptional regulator [Nonomuraea basaltis]